MDLTPSSKTSFVIIRILAEDSTSLLVWSAHLLDLPIGFPPGIAESWLRLSSSVRNLPSSMEIPRLNNRDLHSGSICYHKHLSEHCNPTCLISLSEYRLVRFVWTHLSLSLPYRKGHPSRLRPNHPESIVCTCSAGIGL